MVAVFTQPDRPAGRKRKPTPTPIGAYAAEHLPGVPLYKPEDINAAEWREVLAALPLGEAEVSHDASRPVVRAVGEAKGAAVVVAFGQKLGPGVLADRLFVNLHASRLPRWRGAAPIHHAILAGDKMTGNSVITLADRMDAGLVLGMSERAIDATVTTGELHDRLAEDGPRVMLEVLAAYGRGELEPRVQDESRVTLAGKLTKEMGYVDWGEGAATLRRRMHAFNPWPTVMGTFRGEPVKLLRGAEASDAELRAMDSEQLRASAPGSVVDAERGLVRVGGAGAAEALRLVEVQPAGKRAMGWSDFANGVRLRGGERFGSLSDEGTERTDG